MKQAFILIALFLSCGCLKGQDSTRICSFPKGYTYPCLIGKDGLLINKLLVTHPDWNLTSINPILDTVTEEDLKAFRAVNILKISDNNILTIPVKEFSLLLTHDIDTVRANSVGPSFSQEIIEILSKVKPRTRVIFYGFRFVDPDFPTVYRSSSSLHVYIKD